MGDADRTAVAERLSAHAAAGRLTVEELERRLDTANAAVYQRDLDAVERDLPRTVTERPRPAVRTPWLAAPALLVVLGVALGAFAGHPVLPPFVVALVLWRVAHRPRWGRALTEGSVR